MRTHCRPHPPPPAPTWNRKLANRNSRNWNARNRIIPAARCPASPRQPSKFSGVSSLTLFFPASFNEDVSIISYLGFKGEATNYKHGVVEFVYESQAQLKDHKTQSEQGATAGPGQF